MNRLLRRILKAVGVLALMAPLLAQQSAISEPPVVLYGTIDGGVSTPTAMEWILSGNSETATISEFQTITVDSQTFYIVKIPFESRTVVGQPALTPTANTLELTQADTSYTRSVTVDGESVTLPSGTESFTYGFPSQGLIERIDIQIGPETYEQWSLRIFGSVVDPKGDEDKDGRTNGEEFLDGTDPQDGSSLSLLTAFTPLPGGGFSLTFNTLEGRTYTIRRSTNLENWQIVFEDIPGTGEPITRTDNPGAGAKIFYRIEASESP